MAVHDSGGGRGQNVSKSVQICMAYFLNGPLVCLNERKFVAWRFIKLKNLARLRSSLGFLYKGIALLIMPTMTAGICNLSPQ